MSKSVKSRVRVAVDVSLVLAVAMSAIIFFIPTEAKASCYYPRRVVIKYFGYMYDSGDGGDTPHCNAPVVGPPLPGVYPRTQVGERVTECDGSVTQWGIVCSGDAEFSSTVCEPICD
ncbi:MAG: hypothetical protein QOJ98_1724 [Acidobacteriota bacterium]|jgi:hypothetical protein|nr:hypothetical protein [Acidobacteriota bacterium]